MFRQQQRQLAEEFLASQRGQGDPDGQLAFVGYQPFQAQAHGLQIAIGHQVQPHRGRNEQGGGNGDLIGRGTQHQHGFRADLAAVGSQQRFGRQFELVLLQRSQDGVLPGAFAGF
ncbi:hypothetical protein G6F65_020403 [Rhizopus arrhizus]|nr:hypothetical protein G6F65_020403 [Rhizopus arrhizus]